METCQDLVKQEGAGLGDGQRSRHLLCPACHGGSSHELSFVVTRHGHYLFFMCYRNGCGVRGRVTPNGPILSAPRKRPVRRYKGAPVPMSTPTLERLSAKLHLDERTIRTQGWKWDAEDQRIYMPVYNHVGQQTGAVLRSYSKIPKAISYMEDGYDDAPKIHFPLQSTKENYDPLVLVEDIPSAVRLSHYVPAAALMGTHLADNVAQELVRIGTRALYIALDADAKGKAIDLRNQYRLLFPAIHVIFLEQDVKDMTDGQFRELLDRVH